MVTNRIPALDITSAKLPLSNAQLAQRLTEVAELLEEKKANPFRVRAYRWAAETILGHDESIAQIVQSHGAAALTGWPGIGESIAHALEQLCQTGDWPLLNQLRGQTHEATVLATVAGLGPKLAARIRGNFGIETLPELEAAAYDGRLASLPGIGRKRLRAIRDSLAGRFQRTGRLQAVPVIVSHEPPVEELLSIDEEYRMKANNGRLLQVAPTRFNPTRELWLPILHTRRNNQKYTAMYSNSALAHQLEMTHDWVVIVRERPDPAQWTIVTGRRGSLADRRIIRGRETECEAHYGRIEELGRYDAFGE